MLRRPLSLVCLSLLCLGCGGGPAGPKTYPVAGTVTYEGQPVAAGSILFVPNSELGTTGPATSVEIKDGKFATPSGQGVVAGTHTAEIEMLGDIIPGSQSAPEEEGPSRKSLGTLQYRVEVPEGGVQDLKIDLTKPQAT